MRFSKYSKAYIKIKFKYIHNAFSSWEGIKEWVLLEEIIIFSIYIKIKPVLPRRPPFD